MCSITLRRWAAVLSVFLLIAAAAAPAQVTYYVDDDAPGDPGPGDPTISDPLEDGTAAHPFDAIQEGIDAAIAGDTVLVQGGTYTGTGNKVLGYGGKDITLVSANGAANTIIDCEGSGRGFLFLNTHETAAAVLDGFTVTNAFNGGPGAGIWINSDVTVRNCVFSGNTSGRGGGVNCEYSTATFTDCEFRGNVSNGSGGGIALLHGAPSFVNCLIVENDAASNGGGLLSVESDATMTNCTVANNSAENGGGAHVNHAAEVTVTNCVFQGNAALLGAEFVVVSSASNLSTLTISYCDVVGGLGATYVDSGSTLNWGGGMIDADPQFIDAAGGDYHLVAGSPCVDAGTNSPPGGLPSTDLDGDPRPTNGDGDLEPWTGVAETSDMGVDEIPAPTTPFICVSADSLVFTAPAGGPDPNEQTLSIWNCGVETLNWEIVESCPWLAADPNSGDSIGESDAVTVSVDVTGLTAGVYDCTLEVVDPAAANSPRPVNVSLYVGNFLLVPGEYPTIQAATDAAQPGNTVLVADGLYTGVGNRGIDFLGKDVVVRSQNGPANCVIDCEQADRGFHFHTGETNAARLEGFTITNGFGDGGGGILCESSSPTIVGCVVDYCDISSNSSPSPPNYGGGVLCESSSAVLEDCVISGNLTGDGLYEEYYGSPGGFGAGLACRSSAVTLVRCVISDNVTGNGGDAGSHMASAAGYGGWGGGIYCEDSSLAIVNCIITGNQTGDGGNTAYVGLPGTGGEGGGLCASGTSAVELVNCRISGNATGYGGDVLDFSPARRGNGGAVYNDGASTILITDCTMVDNTAAAGAAIYNSGGVATVANSIVWNNLPTEISGTVAATYSDVRGGWTGVGNIDADPLLTSDYHASAGSPCIDAGDNTALPADAFDLDDDGNFAEPIPLDLDGGTRQFDDLNTTDTGNGPPPVVDMGAYEYQCVGDIDNDGAVDLADLANLLSNYGVSSGASYADGDMDGDGDVDLSDLAALLGVYGTSCP